MSNRLTNHRKTMTNDIAHKKPLSIHAATLLMAAVAVARGSSFIFSKLLLQTMEPLNLLGIRSLTAFLVLFAFFGHRVITSVRDNRRNLRAGALLGLMYFLIMTLELNGLKLTTAATASFIENSAVVLVPLFEAVILRRRPGKITLASAALCLAGVGFIAAGDMSGRIGTGEIMCMTAALLYTGAIIVTDREAKRCDAFTVGILYVGFMGVFGMAGSFVTERPHMPGTAHEWLLLLMLAVICSAFGFAMQPVAQRTISSETAGVLTALNPLTTAILGTIVLTEPFGINSIAGAVLILMGVVLHNVIRKGR